MNNLLTFWEYIDQVVSITPENHEDWEQVRAEYKRYRNRENKRRQRKKYTEVTVKLLPKEREKIDVERKNTRLSRPAYIKYAVLNDHAQVFDPLDLKHLNYLLGVLAQLIQKHQSPQHEEIQTLLQKIKNHVH